MVATFDQKRNIQSNNNNPKILTVGNDYIKHQRADEQTVNNQWDGNSNNTKDKKNAQKKRGKNK